SGARKRRSERLRLRPERTEPRGLPALRALRRANAASAATLGGPPRPRLEPRPDGGRPSARPRRARHEPRRPALDTIRSTPPRAHAQNCLRSSLAARWRWHTAGGFDDVVPGRPHVGRDFSVGHPHFARFGLFFLRL